MNKPHVLVIEDNREIRISARFVLEDFGYSCSEVENPAQAKIYLTENNTNLILLDMNFERDTTSGEEGLNFLKWRQQQELDVPVIAMTAWANTSLVVQAMQLGASDFIEKPWVNQRLHQVLQQQLQITSLKKQNHALTQQLETTNEERFSSVIEFKSIAMKQLLEKLTLAAKSDASILLTGENGTGKSFLAEWIHRHSSRSTQPFVTVNMGAIPETLFESEFFGHKKGAFTDAKDCRMGRIEIAQGGSLFLDEVTSIPNVQQPKLLRVLESNEYEILGSSQTQKADIRVISATNSDISQLIAQKEFREDLYYRLNTLEFRVPALRERPEDIEILSEYFLNKFRKKYKKYSLEFCEETLDALQNYQWPGNLRELSHLIERAVLLSQSQQIEIADLALPEIFSTHSLTRATSKTATSPTLAASQMGLPTITLESAELQLIQQALSKTQGNKQKTADLLGITKSSLYRRLEKYGLAN